MAALPKLSFCSNRRFGIELEVNAFDGKDRPDPGHKVAGIDEVGMLVSKYSSEGSDIREYQHTVDNDVWVIKPDSSCGMEVCTPIYKSWQGINKVCEVVEAFKNSPKIKVDQRCSVHVHVEVADLSPEQLASVIAYWIKCEPVFLDSVPTNRKRNRYCQFMAFNNLVNINTKISANELIQKVGKVKYYSLNTNQMVKNGRKTVEFRIIEGEGCKDPVLIKNWTRLLLQFVERASQKPFPAPYEENNVWSSYCWLDPTEVFSLLGFDPTEYKLSPGLEQTRNWFLARLQRYMAKDVETGFRKYAYADLQRLTNRLAEYGVDKNYENYLSPADLKNDLYNETLRV